MVTSRTKIMLTPLYRALKTGNDIFDFSKL